MGRVTVNILPDNVLLHVFDFDRVNDYPYLWWPWHRLVHVCQRWRSVVFASPLFLGLALYCSPGKRVELLDIWPPLPIIIQNGINWPFPDDYGIDAALMQHDRVCEIHLFSLRSSLLQRLASVMKGQLPALRLLRLDFGDDSPSPALPDTFLGGSSPRLETLELYSIPFPTLPKLLLSATDLVHLSIRSIPHTGYISPEAMIRCLAALANLESLAIGFQSQRSFPDRRIQHPPSRTRALLPALKVLHFDGVSEYLEDFVAQIEAPLLATFHILLFNRLIFDMPQFSLFVNGTSKLNSPSCAEVCFSKHSVYIALEEAAGFGITFEISSKRTGRQLSALEQICGQRSPASPLAGPIRKVQQLEICEVRSEWQDDIDKTQWLEFLRSFVGVNTLCLSKVLMPLVLPALREGGATDLLPALSALSLEGLEAPFVAPNDFSVELVSIRPWDRWKTSARCKLSRTDSCP